MPQNFFITGLPKAGKTVLLRRLIKALRARGLKVGGLISPEEKHHGTRTGFYVKDVSSGRITRLADVNADGPKVSKYHVDVKSFESVAVPAMESHQSFDVFVIDEIGPMELKSMKFSDLLDDILESDTLVVASVHNDLAPRYGFNGELILLADTNREAVFQQLLLRTRDISKKKERKRKAPARKAGKKAAAKPRKKKEPKPKKAKAAPKKEKKVEKKAAKPKREREPAPPEKEEAEEEERPGKRRKGFFDRIKELFHD